MGENRKVLILGGTGNFGARIARRLAGCDDLNVVVTSRNLIRAEVLARDLSASGGSTNFTSLAMDQSAPDFEVQLEDAAPFAVIHTAGPYQGQDYRVAKACIEAGSHYIDLADGRDFVAGFPVLDEAAKSADLLLVSGASTLPGVSSAVIAEASGRFNRIEEIEMSIAPAHRTPRGLGTVAAVLSYCGQPFKTLSCGRWKTIYGWQDLQLQKYSELGRRLSGACDVPDLELLPQFVPGVKTVTFHAALEAGWEQLALWSMAWLTRLGIVRDWSRYARRFARLSQNLIGLGSDRGGMRIRICGTGHAEEPVRIEWLLLAHDNHGPEIPCTPSIVLVKKLISGQMDLRGAMPCLGLFQVADFMEELKEFAVTASFEEN